MRTRQAGITFIGWLFLLVPVAIVGYAAIRLTPLYLNYTKVVRSMQTVADEHQGEERLNAQAVRIGLQNRFDVEDVEMPRPADIKVSREAEGWVLEADYEDSRPLFAGISLLVHFNKRVPVK